MHSDKRYNWQRYWIPQGEAPSLADGFFVEPSDRPLWFSARSNGVPLTKLKEVPCLVLLGDVGMGKSTTLQGESQALRAAVKGQNHAVLFQDLKCLTERQICKRVLESPEVLAWAKGVHPLTVFLDSLDECWRRLPELESILVEGFDALQKNTQQALYLRLTCRSAEWRGEAGVALKQLFAAHSAQDRVKVLVLAPLSPANVEAAAAAHGLNGHRFVTAVESKGVQALASHPITLEMLLSLAEEGSDLPKSRADLYHQGCLKLCSDANVRTQDRTPETLTPTDRMKVASRLAAISVLTNRYLLNCDPERPHFRHDVVDTFDCEGYFREVAGGHEIDVDSCAVIAATQTALFSERTGVLQTWRHQSYAEFLAAWYLAHSKLKKSQILSLLTAADGSGRVVPQLEETVTWLLELDPDLWEDLVEWNADLLVRCDPAILNAEKNRRIIECYLNLVRRHEAAELDWHLRNQLSKLQHPGLAERLCSTILDPTEDRVVREVAIDIAGACGCRALTDKLLAIFLDRSAPFTLRRKAAMALELLRHPALQSSLKQQCVLGELEDQRDDLKGHYLRILWPEELSTSEVLSLLTLPSQRNYLGPYRHFLEYEFARALPDTALSSVLSWLDTNKVSFDILGPYGHFPVHIAQRSVKSLCLPEVRATVFRILRRLVKEHKLHKFFNTSYNEARMVQKERHAFWDCVAQEGSQIAEIMWEPQLRHAGILTSVDLPFFIHRYEATNEQNRKTFWLNLVFAVFDSGDEPELEQVSALAARDAIAQEWLAKRTSCPLVAEEENWAKINYHHEQKRIARTKRRSLPEYVAVVRELLEEFQQGRWGSFWRLVDLLQKNPEDPTDTPSWNIRLSTEKGWEALPGELRAQIVALAPAYLKGISPDSAKLDQEGTVYLEYQAAYQTVVLLYEANRALLENLPFETWERLAPILVFYHDRHNGSRDEAHSFIFSVCSKRARVTFLRCLRDFLERHINHDHKRLVLVHACAGWSVEVRDILRLALLKPGLTRSAALDLLGILAERDPVCTKEYLLSSFATGTSVAGSDALVPVSGALLWANWPEQMSLQVLTTCKADSALGQSVIACLLRTRIDRAAWLARLAPEVLGQLWEWLRSLPLKDPYDNPGSDGTLTVEHEVYNFRNAVFNSLKTRGTPESCRVVEALLKTHPEDLWLGNVLAEMRKALRRDEWVKPDVKVLMQCFADGEKRLLRSDSELHAVLLESLKAYQKQLHENPPNLELWNTVRDGQEIVWDPKDENNLSSCLKNHIERDLRERALIADREVQIRPRIGAEPAQLTDILVRAVPFGPTGSPGAPVSVVIEVKGAWNKGVLTDMKGQLYDRYLGTGQFRFGIYVVGYFTCPTWNRDKDARKTSGASRMGIKELWDKLERQTSELSVSERCVDAFVLDARVTSAER